MSLPSALAILMDAKAREISAGSSPPLSRIFEKCRYFALDTAPGLCGQSQSDGARLFALQSHQAVRAPREHMASLSDADSFVRLEHRRCAFDA